MEEDSKMTTKILVGDCRERLRELPPKSVHCVVTSPPYWGLRDYGLPPLVWEHADTVAYRRESGDRHVLCEHEWGGEQARRSMTHQDRLGNAIDPRSGKPAGGKVHGQPGGFSVSQGSFCCRCGAWRGSLGLEPSPELYVQHMVEVFREVRRVMRDDATLWLNLGDSYASNGGFRDYGSYDGATGRASTGGARPAPGNGLKPKDLCGIPWRLAFALQADGWWLRSDIIWHKTNPMPESVRDRPTKAHEYLFLLSKSKRYYYDQEAVREPVSPNWKRGGGAPMPEHGPHVKSGGHRKQVRRVCDVAKGRNRRSVWRLPTQPFKGAHFATFPEALVEPCIKAGTSERGCCPSCGKPWERVVERTPMEVREGKKGRVVRTQCSGTMTKAPTSITTGWRPTCGCGTCDDRDLGSDGVTNHSPEPIPCTVLDPFGGSGTVGVVAERLGRDAILCELNLEYAEMSRKRIKDDAPMFNQVEIE